MGNIVKIKGLTKSYGKHPVFNDFNLEIHQGQITGLLGPNGCGKTTIMKIMAGLINDYSGKVLINGHQIGVETKKIVSYLPETTYLEKHMTPEKAFDLFEDFYEDFDRKKAMDMIAQLNLDPRQKMGAMSKGMQEKLQLTLVMSRNAKLYIMDEPLGGIDPASRSAILETIIKNYNEDSAILMSTHLVYDVERTFDSVVMMGYGGKIIEQGDVDTLRTKYGKSVDEIFREVFKCYSTF